MSNLVLIFAKQKSQRFLLPVVRLLACCGVAPLHLTVLALLFGLLAIFFFDEHYLFALFGSLHILCDLFDGALARFLDQESHLGKILDAFSDRLIEGLLLVVAPVSLTLTLWALGLFFVQQIFFVWTSMALYARSLLFFFFVIGFFVPGVITALILYSAGILWQLFILLRRQRL